MCVAGRGKREVKTSLTTKSAGGGVQRRGKGVTAGGKEGAAVSLPREGNPLQGLMSCLRGHALQTPHSL